jgi:DNA glycosylase AlkZ-like
LSKRGDVRLARVRASAQQFQRPIANRDPIDVVLRSGPVQAQEPRAARLAFRARSRGLSAGDVDRARTEERSLLRIWVMRKTIHLIASEDAGWMVPLFAPATVRWSRGRLAQLGLDRRGQDRAIAVLSDAVETEGALTRRELGVRLEEAGLDLASEHKVHIWLLATLDAGFCLGPDRGASACLVRAADWLGQLEQRPREESLAELARRYLRGYAPADERDFARWAGLPLRDTRLAFERIASELEPVGELFALGRASRAAASPVVRMLGAFDNYNLGYVDRGFALDPAYEKRVNPGGGIVRPSVVVDGLCIATWSSKRSGDRLVVTIEPFEALEPGVEEAIAAEVADVGRFENLAATPRWDRP